MEIHLKKSMSQDATLRATQVIVSVVNPQNNQYSRIGGMILLAMRKSNQIQLVILKPDKSPFVGLQANAQTDWTIQNEVYVSVVAGRARFLLQFGNAAEAQLFSLFALSAKLAASSEPLCIVDRKGSPISGNDRFKVTFKCYDLGADKVQDPVMSEENFEISPTDQTPLSGIAKNGNTNSVYLVQYQHNIIAIAQTVGDASAQPPQQQQQQQQQQTQQKQAVDEKPQEKQRRPSSSQQQNQEKQQTAPPQPTATSAAPPPKQAAPPKPAQQPATSPTAQAKKPATPKKIQPAQAPPPPQYDAQLQSIHNEMQQKFNELSQMIASLRRSQTAQSALPLSSDVLVSSVQRLLIENKLKDQLIAEKQQLIDLLNERHADTRERDDLRVQLAELGSKLSTQRQLTRSKTEKQDELNQEIEKLQAKLVQVKQESEQRLSSLQQTLDEEKQKQAEELDNHRKSLEFQAKQAEEEVARVKEQFERALSENKALKAQASRDISAELQKLKQQMPQLVVKTVKQMVQGVYGMVTDNFDDDEDYDGITVTKAIRRALESTASRMLRQIDPQDEDEDEEEEEEEGQQQ